MFAFSHYLRRVVSLATPGMAAADSSAGFAAAGERAVLADGVNRVLAARRGVAALPAHQLAEREAIKDNELDQHPSHLKS